MISVADLRRVALAHTMNEASTTTTTTTSAASVHEPAQTATSRVIRYRHDPYSYCAITTVSTSLSEQSFFQACELGTSAERERTSPMAPIMSSAGFALPVPASKARAVGKHGEQRRDSKCLRETLEISTNEDGVSEVSSENDASQLAVRHDSSAKRLTQHHPHEQYDRMGSSAMGTPMQQAVLTPDDESLPCESSIPHPCGLPASMAAAGATAVASSVIPRLPSIIRYASVNFRFGSAWFIAPFKTSAGDLVVVEYPANNSLHMGIVASVTTTKPVTFYSPENPNPDTLTEEEIALLPRLLRHARDFDKETKRDLRTHDLRSLQSAQQLAKETGAPIQFLDAEWLLDLSAITFLVNVYGEDEKLVDRLADELASVEGAEVVFTYPASQQTYY